MQKEHAQQREQQREAWRLDDKQAATDGDEDAQPSQGPASHGLVLNLDTADASKEQLRERLRLKLDAFRANRHAEERNKAADEAKRWRQKKLAGGGKAEASNGVSESKATLGKRYRHCFCDEEERT